LTAELDSALAAVFAGDRAAVSDPYPLYRRLREEAPVYAFGESLAVVSTHPLVKSVYLDNARFVTWRSDDRFDTASLGPADRRLCDEIVAFEHLQMVAMNGEDHRRVRSAAHRAFTPRRVAELGDVARQVTDELLDELRVHDAPDFIELAYRVPLLVIMAMLGAPREDAELLKQWGDGIGDIKRSGGAVEVERIRRAHRSIDDFRSYVGEMVARHRRDPGRPSLVAALLAAEDGDRLTQEELVANVLLFLFAGHETTTNLLGNGVYQLLRHRDQWQLLCSDPSLMPSAVEELLRFDPANQMMIRRAAADVELGGVEVAAGTGVMLLNASANRDAQAFAEPDVLDLARRPNDHLTFGQGVHFCLGAPLARLEAAVVFSTLTRRFPELELAAAPEELQWAAHPTLHGLVRMPVALGAERAAAGTVV
jgi:cytochrome P450